MFKFSNISNNRIEQFKDFYDYTIAETEAMNQINEIKTEIMRLNSITKEQFRKINAEIRDSLNGMFTTEVVDKYFTVFTSSWDLSIRVNLPTIEFNSDENNEFRSNVSDIHKFTKLATPEYTELLEAAREDYRNMTGENEKRAKEVSELNRRLNNIALYQQKVVLKKFVEFLNSIGILPYRNITQLKDKLSENGIKYFQDFFKGVKSGNVNVDEMVYSFSNYYRFTTI